jgi:formylglycine-generating enzyme required for sulfatase activity
MKYSPILLLAVWYLMLGSAPAHEVPVSKKLIKDYVFIPSGREGDSILPEFYISSIEVTNRQYRDFINDLIDSGATAKLKIAMVDSLQWAKMIPSAKAFVSYYFKNPAYDDYPVVNISKQGAELYCQWLTEKYNSAARQKAHFALPTEMQWEYAARGGNPKAIYPWPGNSLTYEHKGKYHGTRMCNYRVDTTANLTDIHRQSDTVDITAPSHSFMPNTYEIYNMAGNVAEMISDQPYIKGGSYFSHADKMLISAHEDADLGHGWPTIGFRPVMVYENTSP